MDRNLIEQYAAGAEVPAQAIVGLEKSDLNAFPVPGTWSIQQIILHLMDSDLIGSDRMKRIAAEDKPALVGYNETAFAGRLGYEHLSVRDAAEIFRLNRLMTAEILRRLPAAAFSRHGPALRTGRSHPRTTRGNVRWARRTPPQVHPRKAQPARQAHVT